MLSKTKFYNILRGKKNPGHEASGIRDYYDMKIYFEMKCSTIPFTT